MFKRLFLFGLVFLIITGFFAARGKRKPDPVAIDRAAPTVGPDGVTSVGSIRLFQDYEANEVAADNRYKDKPVRVTGRVVAVEKNLMDAAVLGLTSGNLVFQTMATLTPDETPRAAVLAKGDTIVVQCTGAGSMMRMPQLEKCVLMRREP